MESSSISVVLVEPQHPGNIGMICRAMANFGVTDLRLVNPCNHFHPEAVKFAVFARPLLGQASIFQDLNAAVCDLEITVAATRRKGKLRGDLLTSTQLSSLQEKLTPGGRIGLVFGREDSGLTTEEVATCSHGVEILTAQETGSLNLAQAVLVFLYELSRKEDRNGHAVEQELPTMGEVAPLFGQMESILHRIAFLNPSKPEQSLNTLKNIFRKASLTRDELSLLRGMWSQIEWSIRDWQGRKRGG